MSLSVSNERGDSYFTVVYCQSSLSCRNSVLCRPFDAATYEDEVDDDDVMDEEGRTRLKLKVVKSMADN